MFGVIKKNVFFLFFRDSMDSITTAYPNVTTPTCETSDTPLYVGFITASLAVVFYGTTYIPVKKFDTGDGNCCGFHSSDISNKALRMRIVLCVSPGRRIRLFFWLYSM